MKIPDPEVASAQLASIFPPLYEAFEHGTSVAADLFDDWGFDFEGHTFSSITRLHAIPVLDARCRDLAGCERTPLANSGIQVTFAGYQLRCWKTANGELPNPSSTAKLRFLHQLPLDLPVFSDGAIDPADRGNLVVQWQYNLVTKTVELTLVCPKPGNHEPVLTEVAWSRPIPRPTDTLYVEQLTKATQEDVEDLEFIRLKPAEWTAESS